MDEDPTIARLRIMIYILFSSLIFFIFILSLYKKENVQLTKFLFFISYILIVFFIGLRLETGGPDWVSYKSFFTSIEPLSDIVFSPEEDYFFYNHGFEFLFKLYSSLIKTFTNNYIFLNLISFALSFFIVANFIYKSSPYPILSVFLYFCTVSLLGDMTIVRQMLSVSVFIYSLKYVLQQQLLKYLICCLIATLFHYSAIIIVPFYWLYKFVWKPSYFIPIVICSLISSLIFSTMLDFLLQFFITNLNLGFAITFKLEQYLLELGDVSDKFGVGVLERFALFLLIIKYKKHIITFFPVYGKLIISLSVMNIVLSLIFLNFTVFYLRFRYFFLFSNSILYVYFIFIFRQKIIAIFSLYFYGIAWVLLVVLSNKNLYLPYSNYIGYIFTNVKVDRVEMIKRSFD
jgi:hypothetical protein